VSQRSAPHTEDAFRRARPHKRLRPSPIPRCPKPRAEYLISEYLISLCESYGAAMWVCLSRLCGARLGTLRCGRVERRADSETLGRVVRHGVGLLIRAAHACEVRLNRSGVQRSSRLNELRCQGEGSVWRESRNRTGRLEGLLLHGAGVVVVVHAHALLVVGQAEDGCGGDDLRHAGWHHA
jgi:hypothetical protein